MPPLHRQLSPEGFVDFPAEPPLEPHLRVRARQRFYEIVEALEAVNPSAARDQQYSRPRLVRLTYEYALSDEAKDKFLLAFFRAMALAIDGKEDLDHEELHPVFLSFADHLMDSFFLPLKASAKRTLQPSPAYHSAVERLQGGGTQDLAGTADRVSALRGACLIRDRHRCVVSRKFDWNEASRRLADNSEALDDDGNRLEYDESPFEILEVAHILPHSLTKVDADSQLNPSKKAALAILDMFDTGITHLIEGNGIDQPRNALTLTHAFHQAFGQFKIFFEATDRPHTYRIQSFLPRGLVRDISFPITRTLYLTETRTIDPPLPRLLAVHRAIAYILHLSAAGEYIDKLLRDMEAQDVRTDGSTDLARLVGLSLGGWLSDSVFT